MSIKLASTSSSRLRVRLIQLPDSPRLLHWSLCSIGLHHRGQVHDHRDGDNTPIEAWPPIYPGGERISRNINSTFMTAFAILSLLLQLPQCCRSMFAQSQGQTRPNRGGGDVLVQASSSLSDVGLGRGTRRDFAAAMLDQDDDGGNQEDLEQLSPRRSASTRNEFHGMASSSALGLGPRKRP
jgi:hypothetical protein